MKMASLGEFGFIDLVRARAHGPRGLLSKGIGDDAAVIDCPPAGKQLLWTVDMLVEGIHFDLSYTPARLLGRKSLSVNLSDIAAMGGEPVACLVSVGFTKQTDVDFAKDLMGGFLEVAGAHSCPLAGGDTVSAPQIVIDVTVLGVAPAGEAYLRSTARPGELIMVTGPLGDSAAGLEALKRGLGREDSWKTLVSAHLDPVPRLREAAAARSAGGVRSMMDISDGLANEVNHIARESSAGAVIWADRIPLSSASMELCAEAGLSALDLALYGGEDYELVFTAEARDAQRIAEAIRDATGTMVAVVGEVVDAGKGVKISAGGRESDLLPLAYDHFRARGE
ncbi:MAG: thiamine-phosphate kinase [Bacillota bacterium]|jgi:thiamine-monophosphate kinase|nr:thiamine-phosphate kinase [Bacillota bacterium]